MYHFHLSCKGCPEVHFLLVVIMRKIMILGGHRKLHSHCALSHRVYLCTINLVILKPTLRWYLFLKICFGIVASRPIPGNLVWGGGGELKSVLPRYKTIRAYTVRLTYTQALQIHVEHLPIVGNGFVQIKRFSLTHREFMHHELQP